MIGHARRLGLSILLMGAIGAVLLWAAPTSEPSSPSSTGPIRQAEPEAERVIVLDDSDALRATGPEGTAPTGSSSTGAFETPVGPEPGQRAPDFSLQTLGGETRDLRPMNGRPVLINVWASYCPFCEHEMPTLEEIDDTYRDLIVLGLNVGEGPQTIEPFIGRLDVDYPILLDETGEVSTRYRVSSLPATILINADGVVAWRHDGSVKRATLKTQIQKHTSRTESTDNGGQRNDSQIWRE